MDCTASKGIKEPVTNNGSQKMEGGKSYGVCQVSLPNATLISAVDFSISFLQFNFRNPYSEDAFFEELYYSLYGILESENSAV